MLVVITCKKSVRLGMIPNDFDWHCLVIQKIRNRPSNWFILSLQVHVQKKDRREKLLA